MGNKIDGIDEAGGSSRISEIIQRYEQQIEAEAANAASSKAGVTNTQTAKDAARLPDQKETADDGAKRSEEALRHSERQRAAGESWQRYADKASSDTLPPSVEDAAKEAREAQRNADERREEEVKKIVAADLQAQLTLQNGRIRG